jgi:hypothetical protein
MTMGGSVRDGHLCSWRVRKAGGGLVTVAHTRDPVLGWFEIRPEDCNDELIERSPGVYVRGSRGLIPGSRSAAA